MGGRLYISRKSSPDIPPVQYFQVLIKRNSHFSFPIFLCLFILNGCISQLFQGPTQVAVNPGTISEIPLRMENGLIFIEADIHGTQGWFLFDNGFSQSAINPEFARRTGIEFNTSSGLTDFHNKSMDTPKTNVDTTRIGDFNFLKTEFYKISTDHLFPCTSVHGIIGGNIINAANWEIDFENQKMRISKEPFSNPGTPLEVEFKRNNETMVNITIGGKLPIKCKIDFGSNSALNLRYDVAKLHLAGMAVEESEGIRAISTHGPGPIETYYRIVDPLLLSQGDHVLLPAATVLTPRLKYAGYLGTEYFRQYKVTINSSEEKYILSPNTTITDTEINYEYGLGLYLLEGKWKIIQKSLTDTALVNIPLLHIVAEIDQMPAIQFKDICAFREYLEGKKARKEPLIVKLQGSEDVVILPFETPKSIILE